MTDANLVLGRLDPGYFLGGRMTLDRDRAVAALQPLADASGLTLVDLASSMVEIANENMASAIKMVSIARGYDPRMFALFAFGGAGPLHAAAVARSLRIPRVLVPLHPGNASAIGMLIADLRVDKVWTQAFKSTDVDATVVARQFDRIREAAVAELRSEGFAGEPTIAYAINMRYLGQNYEHEVPVAAITEATLRQAYDTFTRLHDARYGYAIEDEVIELVSFRVTASGERVKPRLTTPPVIGTGVARPSREVHFRGRGFVTATVHERYTLAVGTVLDGPCILDEPGSTTLVEPGMRVTMLADGQLLIDTGA